MSLEIPEEVVARQPPEAQEIIRALLAKIRELEARRRVRPAAPSSSPGKNSVRQRIPPTGEAVLNRKGGKLSRS